MADYISREDVIKKIAEKQDKAMYGREDVAFYQAIKIIREEPPADVQPEKHGRWEEVPDWYGNDVHYRCSACNAEFYLEVGTPEYNEYWYCPRCGARMDGNTE